jgi:pyridoxal phosphate enzyme (YggS family)
VQTTPILLVLTNTFLLLRRTNVLSGFYVFLQKKFIMDGIKENLQKIRKQIPDNVTLIAVSKTKPIEDIELAYEAGHRCFGENKAQEMKSKYEKLPHDIEWHFIGHLQSNKVKYIASFVHLIHSVDSYKLLMEINRQAEKDCRVIDCLLQFYIATEETKYGFSMEEANTMLTDEHFKQLQHIRLCGVMGMATLTDNKTQIHNEFKTLHAYFNQLKQTYFPNSSYFKEISMGMTDDFPIAIEEGSTMVRIGSAIFGKRNYNKL